MKKTILLLAISCISIISCKKETNTEASTPKTETTPKFSVNAKKSTVNWTAYKTTAKKGVNGSFTKINITNPIKSNTKQGALNNLHFSIPVSSFFSNNEARDAKIQKLFFGLMKDPTLVSGYYNNIKGNDKEGSVTLNLKMNGETVAVPMQYTINENTISLKGTLKNLMDWKLETAFNSLHNACKEKHTGPDGVSKTWTDVAISATAVLDKQ